MIRNNVKVYHCIFSDIWHHKVQNSQSQLSKYRVTQSWVEGSAVWGDRRQKTAGLELGSRGEPGQISLPFGSHRPAV